MSLPERHIAIIGAGLAGSLLAILLARRGWNVDVYEKRGDPRIRGYQGGRSINLALAERGRYALQQAGAEAAVMRHAVMMRGRMVHFADGRVELQRYGRDESEVIWSVHRGDLNLSLLQLASEAGAQFHFNRRLEEVDFDGRDLVLIDERTGASHGAPFSALVGADGAGSTLRAAMDAYQPLGVHSQLLDHAYKELEIPRSADGDFRIDPNALHIWPRGQYMCIALPNDEKTFTVTLFMAAKDDVGAAPNFEAVATPEQARALFARDFPDALPLIPELEAAWTANPIGALGTVRLERWHLDGRAVLVGDAAHAMVPFHGQGMNCAFEDCVALADHLQASLSGSDCDTHAAFAAFAAQRMPDATAIQHMALENYVEMRDRVDDADFLLQRELERALQLRHPDRFVPHYTMVSFMRIPYSLALQRSEIQRQLMIDATAGLSTLDAVDWPRIDAEVERLLPRLSEVAG